MALETSKKISAQRQIERAITHFHNNDIDCAITLSAAAEGMLPETDDPHLFQFLQPHNPELDINLVINWLKHPFEPDTATITEFEGAITIARAITKYVAVYHQSCQPFEEFLMWAHSKNHIPRLY